MNDLFFKKAQLEGTGLPGMVGIASKRRPLGALVAGGPWGPIRQPIQTWFHHHLYKFATSERFSDVGSFYPEAIQVDGILPQLHGLGMPPWCPSQAGQVQTVHVQVKKAKDQEQGICRESLGHWNRLFGVPGNCPVPSKTRTEWEESTPPHQRPAQLTSLGILQ